MEFSYKLIKIAEPKTLSVYFPNTHIASFFCAVHSYIRSAQQHALYESASA